MSNCKEVLVRHLFVVMIFASPFTALRFYKVGVAEISGVILFCTLFFSREYKINFEKRNEYVFTKFWIAYLTLSFVGAFFNHVVNSTTSGSINGLIFDTISYVFVLIVCFSMEVIICNSKTLDIEYVIKKSYLFLSLTFVFLFILSHYKESLFGFKLLYLNYFSPFATNIHHTVMVAMILPFLGLFTISKQNKMLLKGFYLLLVVSNFIIIYNVGTSKGTLGLALGLSAMIVFMIVNSKIRCDLKMFVCGIIIIVLFIISAYYLNVIINLLLDYFLQNDGGGARSNLYKLALIKIRDALCFGYGPGSHIRIQAYHLYDAHQTFLTAVIQAGIFGGIALFYLLVTVFLKIMYSPYLMGAFFSIMVYIMGGDILRRLPIWIILILLYYAKWNHNYKFDA